MTNFRIDLPSGHRALRLGRHSLGGSIYLVTTTTLDRARRFDDFEVAACVCRCITTPVLLGDARMLAWVLMPDHAHWLIELGQRDSLQLVVTRLKSASARSVNRRFDTRGALWARAYHDRAMRCWREVRVAARYIVENPLRAGLSKSVGDYSFWDTVWTDADGFVDAAVP